MSNPPLVVTLALDAASQARLDALRRAHFPPELNYLGAHVTLFHRLPGAQSAAVEQDVCEVAALRSPFPVGVTGFRLLGRGVALTLTSASLEAVRANLAQRWQRWLTVQDRHPFKPHVTVQNKVTAAVARDLHEQLSAAFEPWNATATGIALWHYLGGPWEPVRTVPFR